MRSLFITLFVTLFFSPVFAYVTAQCPTHWKTGMDGCLVGTGAISRAIPMKIDCVHIGGPCILPRCFVGPHPTKFIKAALAVYPGHGECLECVYDNNVIVYVEIGSEMFKINTCKINGSTVTCDYNSN